MFTWDCPKCGKELDIATAVCPECGFTEASPIEDPPPRPAPRPVAPAPAALPAAQAPPMQSAPAPVLPPPTAYEPPPPPQHALSVPAKPLIIISLLLVAAIAGFLYYQHGETLKQSAGLVLENVPADPMEMQDATGESVSGLEVVGIRTWYDDKSKPKVRAIVINHTDEGVPKIGLSVQLRPREATRNAPPLASFEVRLKDVLGPRESKEIETDLIALGTLASLPHWSKVRVDIAPL